MVDITSLKSRIKEQAMSNPDLAAELRKAGIEISQIDSMSGQELKTIMNPKVMGMIGMSMDDFDK